MSVPGKKCAANSVAAVYCAYTCSRFQVPQFQGTFQTHQWSAEITETNVPLDADASIWSSALRHKVLTSVRCPGRSTENIRVASGVSSLDLVGSGILYTSRAFDDSATKSCRVTSQSHTVFEWVDTNLNTRFRCNFLGAKIEGSNFCARSNHKVRSEKINHIDLLVIIHSILHDIINIFPFFVAFPLLFCALFPSSLFLSDFLLSSDTKDFDGSVMRLNSKEWLRWVE